MLTDTTTLDIEAEELQIEPAVASELIRKCADESYWVEYQKRYNGLVGRYENIKGRLGKIEGLRQERKAKREQLEAFLAILLQHGTVLTEFDETLWYAVVDKVTVHASNDIQFTFRDCTVIKA